MALCIIVKCCYSLSIKTAYNNNDDEDIYTQIADCFSGPAKKTKGDPARVQAQRRERQYLQSEYDLELSEKGDEPRFSAHTNFKNTDN